MAEVPAWARWNASAEAGSWTVGIEEEVMLIDDASGSLVNRADDVLAAAPPHLARSLSPETHACVIELKTSPHPTVRAAAAELARLRRELDDVLRDGWGVRAAVAGTHPLAAGNAATVSRRPRSREVAATMRVLARREPTSALHVHVAVPDGETAVRALDGLRAELPVLLALSANSPYWRGEDSGFASMRTPVFGMFPRVGIPRRFETYGDYVEAVDRLLRADAVPEPRFLWWDARLQPRLGTVEVRIMDAQSRVSDTAALAALVHCLVCGVASRWAHRRRPDDAAPEVLEENRFLAARDGMAARLIEPRSGRRRAVRGTVTELLASCDSLAPQLGCTAELMSVAALADDPGATRQRRRAAVAGPDALPAWLADEFTGEPRALAVG
jgi:glutamate---cysteine ligase / carboxylate-amine ligase